MSSGALFIDILLEKINDNLSKNKIKNNNFYTSKSLNEKLISNYFLKKFKCVVSLKHSAQNIQSCEALLDIFLVKLMM